MNQTKYYSVRSIKGKLVKNSGNVAKPDVKRIIDEGDEILEIICAVETRCNKEEFLEYLKAGVFK